MTTAERTQPTQAELIRILVAGAPPLPAREREQLRRLIKRASSAT